MIHVCDLGDVIVSRSTDEMIYRVKVFPNLNGGRGKSKTFKGETAWCDSYRYVCDIVGYTRWPEQW